MYVRFSFGGDFNLNGKRIAYELVYLNIIFKRDIYRENDKENMEFDHDDESRDGHCFKCLPLLEWLRPYAPRPCRVFAV